MPETRAPAARSAYRVGAWEIIPSLGLLRRQEEEVRLTSQQMRLLALLIANGRQVTLRETIFEEVWDGAAVEENALARCISEIRRVLGDDARRPTYIETLPKRGYRLIADVDLLTETIPNVPPPTVSRAALKGPASPQMVAPDVSAPDVSERTGWSGHLATVGLVGTALVLLVWWGPSAVRWPERPHPSKLQVREPPGTQPTVAVLTLASHHPDAETLRLSGALAEMLTSEVAATGDLAVVPRAVVSALRHELSLSLDADQMTQTLDRILRALDLDYLIGGAFLVTEGDHAQLRLDLRIHGRLTPAVPRALTESGAMERLPDVVASVGQRLRETLGAAAVPDAQRRRAPTHHANDVIAIQRYVDALGALRRQENQSAITWLEESLRLRPDQPLPYLALSEAWSQLGYRRRAQEAAQRAKESMSDLGTDYQTWIEAHLATVGHAWSEAVDLYRILWARRPENLEIGLRLARAQISAGNGANAIETLATLRSRVVGPQVDPRFDLAEAIALHQQNRPELALQAAERAIEQAFSGGAGLVVGRARLLSAKILYQIGRTGQAKVTLEQARHIFEKAEDDRRLAQVQSTLASWFMTEGDFVGARERTAETLATFRRIGDLGSVARQLMVLADVEQELGSAETAVAMIKEATELFREVDDPSGSAGAFSVRGIIAAKEGQFETAEANFSESLRLYRALGNRAEEGSQLINIARVHMLSGRWSEARTFFKSAESILAESGNVWSLAQLAVNLGLAKAATGDLLGAEPLLRRAVDFYGQLGSNRELANAMALLGEVQVDRGDLTAAQSNLEQALAIRQEIGEPSRIGNSHTTLAVVLIELGRWNIAAAHTAEAMELDGVSSNQVILALRLLARARMGQGRLEEGRQAIHQAVERLAALAPSRTSHTRAHVVITQARIETASGEFEAARERLEALLASAEVQSLSLIMAEARLALAQAEIGAGDVDRAARRLTTLINESEAASWSLLTTKARRAHRALSQPPLAEAERIRGARIEPTVSGVFITQNAKALLGSSKREG